MARKNVSDATLRNWQRLNSDVENKLQHRANKSCSRKRIFPLEYIQGKETLHFIEEILFLVEKKGVSGCDVIYSLAVKLLEKAGIADTRRAGLALSEFSGTLLSDFPTLPADETDILGLVYQCLLFEGEKNKKGSYYTPSHITVEMLSDFDVSEGKTFFDPCCGSGAFLLAAKVESPLQLWGCDKDPNAVFMAKVNLLCRYPDCDFSPRIYCFDYLKAKMEQKFDFIATNPPWGSEKSSRSGERFSRFFRKAAGQLAEGGKISFLFPESVLGIKSHAGFRRFLLENTSLEKVCLYDGVFSGVMTKYVSICACNAPGKTHFLLSDGIFDRQIAVADILQDSDCTFCFVSEENLKILDWLNSQKHFCLSESSFALGIVTGDNKNKLFNTQKAGMEPVITGKEVCRYILSPAVKFLRYDRNTLQQTAPEKYYRAPEKLVYKFISNQLVFAYDNAGLLCLNSANILIPDIPGMSIKTVLAFLNSNVLRYYYQARFKDVKILKGNLMQLPFPEISPEKAVEIDSLTDYILKGCNACEKKLQTLIYRCYKLSPEQIQVIEKTLYPEG